MTSLSGFRWSLLALVALGSGFPSGPQPPHGAGPMPPVVQRFLDRQDEPLSSYRALRRLEAHNTRYKKHGWIEAWTSLDPRDGFKFEIVAEGGSGYVREKVLRKALEREAEAHARAETRNAAIAPANYAFAESRSDVDGLIEVSIEPMRKDPLLLRGRIYLTREDADLVKIEGQLSKTPSFSNDRRQCGQVCADALRSLEYQETLFGALAAWRRTFLSYYRWLETGDPDARAQWISGRERFNTAASDHLARFGRDLDFPAFDLSSATRAASVATRAGWARRAAGLLVIVAAAIILIGNLAQRRQPSRGPWAACVRFARMACRAAAPSDRAGTGLDWRWSMGVASVALTLAAFVVGALTGFTSAWLSAAPLIVVGTVGLVFELTALGPAGEARGRLVAIALRPMIPGLLLLIALIAYLDPMGFWYRFWLSASFRVGVFTVLLATPLWTLFAVLAGPAPTGSRQAIGGLLAAVGAAVVVLTLLLPPWANSLRALDSPLNVAPATETMLFALRTYVGVSLDAGRAPWIAGGLLLAAGFVISRFQNLVRGFRLKRAGK